MTNTTNTPAASGAASRPLTDSQIADIYFEALGQHLREQDRKTVTRFARAIEAATAPQPAAKAAPVDAAVKPAINVGTIGHVGSGRTTLTAALGKLIAAQKVNHD